MNEAVKATISEVGVLTEATTTIALSTGVTVSIYKCKVKQIGAILEFLTYLMDELGMSDMSAQPKVDIDNPTNIMKLIVNGADRIYPVASSLCSLSLEEFTDLELDDAMDIMTTEWEVNKGFFLQKILPMLNTTTPTSPTSKVSRKKRATRKKRAS